MKGWRRKTFFCYTPDMKYLRGFVARLLLFVMAGFVMHDYMTGQRDVVVNETILCMPAQQVNVVAPVVAEHQAFHLLALSERVEQISSANPSVKPFYSYDDLLGDLSFPPLFTPPKTV